MNKTSKIACACILISAIYACKNTKDNKPSSIKENPKEIIGISQTEALREQKKKFVKEAAPEKKKIYQEGIDAISESGMLESAKNVGDVAPDFTLKNALGENISLKDYLQKGPVVLVWYRGGWCPYCNINLRYLQEELPNIKAQGANLVALTPELPDNSMSTSEKLQLEFEVLSDIGNNVAKDYGIVFKLIDKVAEIYNDGFGLNQYNGDTSNELPLAATYIIGTDGKIVYAFLDADYRNRAEPTEITAFLKNIKK